ncbi:DUF167 domain-containing protein [Candidatus Bathyarchaeota archaeon]|jgi:uncharacterized protein (TIGR00251 family)|nr:DUF167 domain-containing protein [Candidatus Bathyarchaeota archaeon]
MTIRITVDVKTGSNFESIDVVGDDHYLVHVKEQPKKGKANKAVIKVLKSHFDSQVFLVAGHTSSRKIFEVL